MTICAACPTLHPHRDPYWADIGHLCSPDYGLLTSWLRSIPDLYHKLLTGEPIPVDHRTTWRLVDAHLGVANRIKVPDDPISHHLPVGPVRSNANNQPRVSGSRERPLGVPIAPLNLIPTVPTINHLRRAPTPSDTLIPLIRRWHTTQTVHLPGHPAPVTVVTWHREPALHPDGTPILIPAGDQTGPHPTARWLDRTAQHWLLNGAPGRLPEPEVPTLVTWLLVRLDWAVDKHPDLGEFAYQLRQARSALNRVLGLNEPQPRLCPGVPCSHCNNVTLIRKSDCVECDHCGKIYDDETYEELLASRRNPKKRSKTT